MASSPQMWVKVVFWKNFNDNKEIKSWNAPNLGFLKRDRQESSSWAEGEYFNPSDEQYNSFACINKGELMHNSFFPPDYRFMEVTIFSQTWNARKGRLFGKKLALQPGGGFTVEMVVSREMESCFHRKLFSEVSWDAFQWGTSTKRQCGERGGEICRK